MGGKACKLRRSCSTIPIGKRGDEHIAAPSASAAQHRFADCSPPTMPVPEPLLPAPLSGDFGAEDGGGLAIVADGDGWLL